MLFFGFVPAFHFIFLAILQLRSGWQLKRMPFQSGLKTKSCAIQTNIVAEANVL